MAQKICAFILQEIWHKPISEEDRNQCIISQFPTQQNTLSFPWVWGKQGVWKQKKQELQVTRDYKQKTICPGTSSPHITIDIDYCLQFWEHQSGKHVF